MGQGTWGKTERCGRQMGREMGHSGKTESRGVGRQLSDVRGATGEDREVEGACDQSDIYI